MNLSKRESNLDALRVLSSIMVVMLHVSASYVTLNIEDPNFYFTVGNLFDSMTRTSVPIFVMLSGAFILDNSENREYITFYKKTYKNIVIPTVKWSFLYFGYSMALQFAASLLTHKEANYLLPILNWIKGSPFYHMWYMYMIIGLYIITPFLIRLIKTIGQRNTFIISIVFLFLGMLIAIKGSLIWPFQFILYIGYFIMGYSLRKYYEINLRKPHNYILGWILSSLSIFLLTELIVRKGWLVGRQLYFYGYLTPFVIIGAIFIYIGFLNIKIIALNKRSLTKHTFNIYVLHAGILSVIKLIELHILRREFNPIFYIPMMTIIVFTLSYIGSLIIYVIKKPKKMI